MDEWEVQQERFKRNREARLTSNKNLTRVVLWLFEHDWDLLVTKNLYMLFHWGNESVTIKLDNNIHVRDYIERGFKYEFKNPDKETLWEFLRENLLNHYMENFNYLYFVKEDRMVIINCGNMTAQFVDNNSMVYKLYQGNNVCISEVGRLSVTGKPIVVQSKRLKVKDSIKTISKNDLMGIHLKDVWRKEVIKFGE